MLNEKGDHICPQCKTELHIGRTRNVLENDNTAEAQTKLYKELEMLCPKPTCPNYHGGNASDPKIIVETIRNEQKIG